MLYGTSSVFWVSEPNVMNEWIQKRNGMFRSIVIFPSLIVPALLLFRLIFLWCITVLWNEVLIGMLEVASLTSVLLCFTRQVSKIIPTPSLIHPFAYHCIFIYYFYVLWGGFFYPLNFKHFPIRRCIIFM